MTVKTVNDAWAIANMMMKHDYIHDAERSSNAGYPIYFTTEKGGDEWISDLTDRLEVNQGATSTSIWILDNMQNPAREVLEDRIEELKRELDEEAKRMIELVQHFRVTSSKYRFANMIHGAAQNMIEGTKILEELEDLLEKIEWME